MELKLNICPDDYCKLTITDISDYQDEESTSSSDYKQLKYSDTISIVSIQVNTTEKSESYKTFFAKHDDSRSITVPIDFDGWFEVHYIVLPTIQWFIKELGKSNNKLSHYDNIYYSNGNNIYKYSNGQSVTIELSELEKVEDKPYNNISDCLSNYFSICNLKKCYINLCKQIFESGAFQKCSSKNKLDCDLTFRRDMVLMTIHVIEYLVEFSQFAEAQRLLERISSCNGLCDNIPNIKINHGCGCGKKLFV